MESLYWGVEGKIFSVAQFLKLVKPSPLTQGEFWVGGRLWIQKDGRRETTKVALRGQGQSLSFHFENESVFLKAINNFIDGDIVVIRMKGSPEIRINDGNSSVGGSFEGMRLCVPQVKPARKCSVPEKVTLQWVQFLSLIRSFFDSQDFVELPTPSLVKCPGMEPHLEPFQTEFSMGKDRRPRFLPTSPELHLKKYLSMGWTEIYEIKTCFRNEEMSPIHQPEFLMLEWYRAFSNLDDLVNDIEELFSFLNQRDLILGAYEPLQVVTMESLFEKHFQFTLTPKTTKDELLQICESEGITVSGSDLWGDIFFMIFLTKIEEGLGAKGPVILRNYPPSQAALARLTLDGWADRFELYWRGMELGNAFNELNDPKEQLRRFDRDQEIRQSLGRIPVFKDDDFIDCLYEGMPPSAGIAVGLERLFLACRNKKSLSELRVFPFS